MPHRTLGRRYLSLPLPILHDLLREERDEDANYDDRELAPIVAPIVPWLRQWLRHVTSPNGQAYARMKSLDSGELVSAFHPKLPSETAVLQLRFAPSHGTKKGRHGRDLP